MSSYLNGSSFLFNFWDVHFALEQADFPTKYKANSGPFGAMEDITWRKENRFLGKMTFSVIACLQTKGREFIERQLSIRGLKYCSRMSGKIALIYLYSHQTKFLLSPVLLYLTCLFLYIWLPCKRRDLASSFDKRACWWCFSQVQDNVIFGIRPLESVFLSALNLRTFKDFFLNVIGKHPKIAEPIYSRDVLRDAFLLSYLDFVCKSKLCSQCSSFLDLQMTVTWTSGYNIDEAVPFVEWGFTGDLQSRSPAATLTFNQMSMCGMSQFISLWYWYEILYAMTAM